MCAKVSSVIRFDMPQAPSLDASKNFYSHGGFLEVTTRKEILGPVDSQKMCTLYAEFSDDPLSGNLPAKEPYGMTLYSSAHCLDLSKDHSIKVHMFDTSIGTYFPFPVKYSTLDKVKFLRSAMKQKKIPADQQRNLLNVFRTNVQTLEDLFNQPVVSSATTGSGKAEIAAELCLKKDDLQFQHVCSTYQDLVAFSVVLDPLSAPAAIELFTQLRASSAGKLREWITSTELAKRFSDPNFSLSFSDEPDKKLDLSALHKEFRARVINYSKLKMLRFLPDELLPQLSGCTDGAQGACLFLDELSQIVGSELSGTRNAVFEKAQLPSVIDTIKSGYTVAQKRMDLIFSVFNPLIRKDEQGAIILPYTSRLHSNFRFISASAPSQDVPDPRDAARAFMSFNVNNIAGDSSGKSVAFIQWNTDKQIGRFSHILIPRNITEEMRQQAAKKEAETKIPTRAHMGILQAGDSGSIVVVEHLPYFAVTSVDGKSTSGGASIRPLPQPVSEDENTEDARAAAKKKPADNACR
ncbi:MAG: hypothetical protein EBR09_15065 [Proteobacteria bacterium]|nr:hypothetical protein [Pseudomonadota bacterium]